MAGCSGSAAPRPSAVSSPSRPTRRPSCTARSFSRASRRRGTPTSAVHRTTRQVLEAERDAGPPSGGARRRRGATGQLRRARASSTLNGRAAQKLATTRAASPAGATRTISRASGDSASAPGLAGASASPSTLRAGGTLTVHAESYKGLVADALVAKLVRSPPAASRCRRSARRGNRRALQHRCEKRGLLQRGGRRRRGLTASLRALCAWRSKGPATAAGATVTASARAPPPAAVACSHPHLHGAPRSSRLRGSCARTRRMATGPTTTTPSASS